MRVKRPIIQGKRITFRCPREDWIHLRYAAKLQKLPVSEILRAMIETWWVKYWKRSGKK